MKVTLDLDVKIEMRDGTLLNAEVWRNDDATRAAPVILIRSPYPDPVARASLDPVRAVRMGFAVVVQQIRGTGSSEGIFEPWVAEAKDGADTIAWCARQSWCSGAVATMGLSYLAHAQLYAAGESAPALRAMVLEVVPSDAYGLTYIGGALALGSAMGWSIAQSANQILRQLDRGEDALPGLQLLNQTLLEEPEPLRQPLRQVELLRRYFPSWEEWLDHPTHDDWWRSRAHRPGPRLPALCVGGWYDIFLRGTLETWRQVNGNPRSRLLIGPWGHNGRTSALGELRFGSEAMSGRVDLMGQELNFLAAELNETDPASETTPAQPPVRLFVMGANNWRDFQEWPPAQAVATDLYLRSDARLTTEPPAVESAFQSFDFDPADPVPTIGGPNLLSDSEAAYQTGPWDQASLDSRPDILRFSTGRLTEAVEVIGEVSVTLWAATSASDTDWTAKLIDVWPDGRAINIADGIIRARHRLSVEKPQLPEPGRPYEYVIDLVATAHCFAPDHRIRIDVSSSNFPRFDINPGTGELMADAEPDSYVVATQRVYVDATHPSRVTLPMIPAAPGAEFPQVTS
jgi:putative CocE/NonD family hydrolase